MHSKIFELTVKRKEEDDFIIPLNFEDDFVGTIADYVSDSNRNEDIDWFIACFEMFGLIYDKTEQSIIFEEGFKNNYFERKFKDLKHVANIITLEQFSGSEETTLAYRLKSNVEDQFGFYVYYDDSHYMPLDYFVRNCINEGTKYYFGGTIDYHC